MLDGDVGAEAFAVIREAINKEGMVAIGKVVFTSREHIIALEARGKGMLGITLRYPYEFGTKKSISTTFPSRRSPSICWTLQRTSLRRRQASSILRNSKINVRMP